MHMNAPKQKTELHGSQPGGKANWQGTFLLVSLTVLAGGRVAQSAEVQCNGHTFQLPDELALDLVVGPPLVKHPGMACFDDRGRLYVSEYAGVNASPEDLEKDLPNSILRLEDTDSDGKFDRSSVFADKMTLPMGAAWHEGALYVASPPYIWRLEDTDDDGVADQRKILISKFGYTGNAASVHGCFLGPDGRLYWVHGRHGHEVRDKEGSLTSQREGSYVFSCRPDGSDVVIHCGGGMDNPVELDFTDAGEMLCTVDIFYARPRVDCLVQMIYGGAYPHYESVLGEFVRTGDLLGPAYRFGHVAVSGLTRYRSGSLEPNFRNNWFVTFFNSGRVVRMELEREGATYRAIMREFLTPTSPSFHATDVLEDADGSLLVIDTGGWFYRGCPTSQIAKPDLFGGIYRVRRHDMPKVHDPWGQQIAWKQQTPEQLVRRLNDSRFKVRERAIAECAKRGDALVPLLSDTLRLGELDERLGAVWALTQIAAQSLSATSALHADARAAIRIALRDADPSVRQVACRGVASAGDMAAIEQLLEIVRIDKPAIRREAATTLGRLGDVKAVPTLLKALESTHDRVNEHALIYALYEINDSASTTAGLGSASTNVRRGALLALDQMASGNLHVDTVTPLLNSDDVGLQRAALDVFRWHTDWGATAATQLEQWLADENIFQLREQAALELTTTFIADPAVRSIIGRFLNDLETLQPVRNMLLRAIAQGHSLPLEESWVVPLSQELDSGDTEAVRLALSVVSAIQTNRFNEQLQQIGSDESRPYLLRVAALEAASGSDGQLGEVAFRLLKDMLTEESFPQQIERAAQVIGVSSLTTTQLQELAPHLQHVGPMVLRDLVHPFQNNNDPDCAKAFLTSMRNAESLLTLPAKELSDVVMNYPEDLLPDANRLLDQLKREETAKRARIDQLAPLLNRGDPQQGSKVFFSEKVGCSVCHSVGDQGKRVGPDLTTIGQNRSEQDLLESIVFPSASIVRQYETYTVLTDAGKSYSGLIARETGDVLYLQQQTGDQVAISRDEIDEIAPSTVSIMPNGMEKNLSKQQLADLIAYLKSLK